MDNSREKAGASGAAGKTPRVHRVGTITFGVVMILFGCLFLLRLILPQIDYLFLFRLWPCTLICLGIEVLAASADKGSVFTYDKTAVVLMVLLVVFSMGMAGMDFILEHAAEYARWSGHPVYVH